MQFGLGIGEIISALVALGTFAAWAAGLWIRVGKILQTVDDLSRDGAMAARQIDEHDTRLTRLEIVAGR